MLEPNILNQMSAEELLHYTNLHVYSDNHFRSLLTKATIVDNLRKKLVNAEEDYRNLESNTYNVIGSIDSFEKRMYEKYYEESDNVEGDPDYANFLIAREMQKKMIDKHVEGDVD